MIEKFLDALYALFQPPAPPPWIAAAWWQLHLITHPLPEFEGPPAEIRAAFLGPFLAHANRLTDYADKTTRHQTRLFWDLTCRADLAFWLRFAAKSPADLSDTSSPDWIVIRDALFSAACAA
jgi:hypothetical protein